MVILYLLMLAVTVVDGESCSGHPCFPSYYFPSAPGYVIAIWFHFLGIIKQSAITTFHSRVLILASFSIPFYFVVGAFIGWLYGKIKNRFK